MLLASSVVMRYRFIVGTGYMEERFFGDGELEIRSLCFGAADIFDDAVG